MKVAIVHDVYIERGGAERVVLALLELYPHADLYIPLLSKENDEMLKEKTTGKVSTSFLNSLPLIHSASVLLKPVIFLYWESLDLSSYDLVISSSHSFSSKAVITSPDTLHLSYIHTSPRYLYTEYNETRILKRPFFKILLQPLLSWLRTKDYIAAQRPDVIVANSRVVQRRIQKYYRRESLQVSPPISTPRKVVASAKREYYVCVSRLAKQKGIDLAIHACNELKLPLYIVGVGSQEKYLKSIAGETIKFLGYVPDSEMKNIYAQAKALIYCSIEEDFGLVPVEAMAHGVPVIGYRSGGTAETVLHSKTGILFDVYSVESLKEAINTFEKKKILSSSCIHRAKLYDIAIFKEKIQKIVAQHREH